MALHLLTIYNNGQFALKLTDERLYLQRNMEVLKWNGFFTIVLGFQEVNGGVWHSYKL